MLAIMLLPAVIVPVFATTVSFSTYLDDETVMVYNSSAVLVGVYNTSTKNINLPSNDSYNFIVQPEGSSLMVNHPDTWFQNVIDSASDHAAGLVFALFIVAVMIAAIARRR